MEEGIEWKRLQEVYPKSRLNNNDSQKYRFEYVGETHNSFMEAMNILKDKDFEVEKVVRKN